MRRAAGAYVPPQRGAMARQCPKCGAPPGHQCGYYAKDANGTRYLVRKLINVHKERRGKR